MGADNTSILNMICVFNTNVVILLLTIQCTECDIAVDI